MKQSVSLPRILIAVVVICVAVLGICAGILPIWVIEAPGRLAFGWILHGRAVFPKATVNWSGVVFFAIVLPATAWLAHCGAAWLWESLCADGSRWRWKWSVLGLMSVILMFVAGIGATGVVHQTGWLITSRESLVERSGSIGAMRVRCGNNMRQIGLALRLYAAENRGYRPADHEEFIRIVSVMDMHPQNLVCPASNDEPAPVTQPSDWTRLIAVPSERGYNHLSYTYLAHPVQGPDGVRKVVLYEPIENHDEDGLNVLYEDAEVEWIGNRRADHWLKSLEALPPSTGKSSD